MADVTTVASSDSSTSAQAGAIRRAWHARAAWAKRHELARAERKRARLEDRAPGILDPDTPLAVRRFGFAPGMFR
ncbi:MAG TPA: hypothetical protein VN045_09300 [Microbacteriaceae bacterium]|jgi:hypothetical protein|nr:hypothetical protein [Microbacteriaceae bacterium]